MAQLCMELPSLLYSNSIVPVAMIHPKCLLKYNPHSSGINRCQNPPEPHYYCNYFYYYYLFIYFYWFLMTYVLGQCLQQRYYILHAYIYSMYLDMYECTHITCTCMHLLYTRTDKLHPLMHAKFTFTHMFLPLHAH